MKNQTYCSYFSP